jgi:hypothetical protein
VADSGIKKFFKISCLGCLGIVVLGVAGMAIFGWLRASSAEFVDARGTQAPERPSEIALPEDQGAPANRVKLLVDSVETVEIRPCGDDESFSVDASYNKKRVEFSETLDEEQDGSWAYTVEMTGSGSYLARMIEKLFSGRGASLEVCLPADTPIALQVELMDAGLEAELGGLWLPTIDVELQRAGTFVNFNAPLREPAESIRIQANMAGGFFSGIGNASPAVLEVEYSMGGLTFDMGGEWRRNAQIDLGGRAGGVTIVIPRSVRVEGVPDLEPTAGASPEAAPTLFFEPGTNFEDVNVKRR